MSYACTIHDQASGFVARLQDDELDKEIDVDGVVFTLTLVDWSKNEAHYVRQWTTTGGALMNQLHDTWKQITGEDARWAGSQPLRPDQRIAQDIAQWLTWAAGWPF